MTLEVEFSGGSEMQKGINAEESYEVKSTEPDDGSMEEGGRQILSPTCTSALSDRGANRGTGTVGRTRREE